MARVELAAGISAIHGRLGDYIFRTVQQADGTNKVFATYAPKQAKKAKK